MSTLKYLPQRVVGVLLFLLSVLNDFKSNYIYKQSKKQSYDSEGISWLLKTEEIVFEDRNNLVGYSNQDVYQNSHQSNYFNQAELNQLYQYEMYDLNWNLNDMTTMITFFNWDI